MNDEEHIEKGMFSYKGVMVMQHPHVANAFRQLFEKTLPSQIIEIGTASGGLTLILKDLLDELNLKDCILRTYDVHDNNYIKLFRANDSSIEMITKNIFNNSYSEILDDEKNDIHNFIQRSGTTIVLCDGGCKINEFNILSDLLKEGDVIMAHDYAPSLQIFTEKHKNKIWNWCEIYDEKIEESCLRNNLKAFLENEFTNVAWACKRK